MEGLEVLGITKGKVVTRLRSAASKLVQWLLLGLLCVLGKQLRHIMTLADHKFYCKLQNKSLGATLVKARTC